MNDTVPTSPSEWHNVEFKDVEWYHGIQPEAEIQNNKLVGLTLNLAGRFIRFKADNIQVQVPTYPTVWVAEGALVKPGAPDGYGLNIAVHSPDKAEVVQRVKTMIDLWYPERSEEVNAVSEQPFEAFGIELKSVGIPFRREAALVEQPRILTP